MKSKAAALVGGSFFLGASVALLLGFSAIAAAATTSPSMCERFPSLAERFPSCRDNTPPPPPPPIDVCPNVPGNQTTGPCADSQCVEQGGTWDGSACALPPPPPPETGNDSRRNECIRYIQSPRNIPPESCDICPNVSGVQLTGLCADTTCVDDGGMWIENACVMPPPDVCPNVPGDQPTGPCADQECVAGGGTWNGTSCDFPPPPPPFDVCPNVPDTQESGPCADKTCLEKDRIWNGIFCEPAFLRVTYPNGGEAFTVGDHVQIKWESSKMDSCQVVQSEGGGGLSLSTNVDTVARSYDWIVIPMWNGKAVPGQKQKILLNCLSLTDGFFQDYSDDFFTVSPPPQCSDSVDNDLDGTIDFPADAGCSSANDDTETISGGSGAGGGGGGGAPSN